MKTLAKQILFGLLALALTLSLVACGGDGDTTATTTTGDEVVTTTNGDGQSDATTTTVDGASQPSGSTSSKVATSTTKAQTNSNKTLTWAQVKANMPANLKGTTITFLNWNEASSITDAEKVIKAFTNETGITVKWEIAEYTDYATKIAAKQTAGTAPDIIRMKEANPAIMKMLQPVSDTGYDFSDAAWDEQVMSAYTYKGKTYAVNMANTLMQLPDVYLYNTAMISKYDLEDPYTLWKQGKWTWSKFVEICEDFAEEAGDTYDAFSPNMWTNGANMLGVDFVTYTNDGYVNTVTDTRLLKGLQMYIKAREAGLFTDSLFQREAFQAGNVLFMHDTVIGTRKTHFYYKDLKNSGTLGVVPVPTVDGQSTYYQLYREMEAYAIPTGASNATAVPYFLRYWLDADNYTSSTFFTNKNVLDVYNWCRSQENAVLTYNASTVLTSDTGVAALSYEAINSTQAQVATVLNKYKNNVESAVRQANSILSTLQ